MTILIDDILLAPVKGVVWIGKKVHDLALEELEDTPEKLKRELLDLQLMLEIGDITEVEYKKREKDILVRLNALKEA